MRMTNKIMQSNSLYNINQTKILEDKYNTQLTSQSKITRPSDDPVVAIRALRLRSNVSTVTQYNEKNAKDADQWLDVTAQSLNTITDVLTNLYKQVETGVNKDYTASDMQVLLTQIEAYTNEMYATGNQDYAGRYIFTGYRTDTALNMEENNLSDQYSIVEKIKPAQIDTLNYTDYRIFDTTAGAAVATENDITHANIGRIRLSYDNVSTFNSIVVKDAAGATQDPTAAGSKLSALASIKNVPGDYATADDAYKAMADNENGAQAPMAIYIEKTGELLLDSKTVQELNDLMENGGTIDLSYDKNTWAISDLNPQHYFECEKTDAKGTIKYNAGGDVNTEITYDVGFNQVIQVNTNAYEVFDPAISRDLADLKKLVEEYVEIERIREDISTELEAMEESDPAYETCKERYNSADKAYTYVRDAVSVRFGSQITRYQNYLDATNVAITKNGTRSTRLELIVSRLENQQSTFKELQEENEGIDMTEVAVLLTSAKTTYDAALMATGKITQNSLINYI